MDLEKIRKTAYERLKTKASNEWDEIGSKYYHGQRVGRLALSLRKFTLPDDDSFDEILTAAAWLHDIQHGRENHAKLGAEEANRLLAGICSDDERKRICAIIEAHDDRGSDRGQFDNLIRLHQDADLLDHFGGPGLWSRFLYAGHHEQSIPDVLAWAKSERLQDCARHRQLLNYDISKVIFDDRCAFISAFFTRFSVEGTGGIWNDDLVLNYYYNANT